MASNYGPRSRSNLAHRSNHFTQRRRDQNRYKVESIAHKALLIGSPMATEPVKKLREELRSNSAPDLLLLKAGWEDSQTECSQAAAEVKHYLESVRKPPTYLILCPGSSKATNSYADNIGVVLDTMTALVPAKNVIMMLEHLDRDSELHAQMTGEANRFIKQALGNVFPGIHTYLPTVGTSAISHMERCFQHVYDTVSKGEPSPRIQSTVKLMIKPDDEQDSPPQKRLCKDVKRDVKMSTVTSSASAAVTSSASAAVTSSASSAAGDQQRIKELEVENEVLKREKASLQQEVKSLQTELRSLIFKSGQDHPRPAYIQQVAEAAVKDEFKSLRAVFNSLKGEVVTLQEHCWKIKPPTPFSSSYQYSPVGDVFSTEEWNADPEPLEGELVVDEDGGTASQEEQEALVISTENDLE